MGKGRERRQGRTKTVKRGGRCSMVVEGRQWRRAPREKEGEREGGRRDREYTKRKRKGGKEGGGKGSMWRYGA